LVGLCFVIYDLLFGLVVAGWTTLRLTVCFFTGRPVILHRLGYLPNRPKGAPVAIWLHAVSVGEWLSAEPVLSAIKGRHPDWWILVTTGQRHAHALAGRQRGVADAVCWLPWDSRWCIELALSRVRPDSLVLVECEIWPNLIERAANRRVRVVMMNARIYRRDHGRYQLARGFFSHVLRRSSFIGAQSAADRARFLRLGARSKTVKRLGNTKYDAASESPDAAILADLKRRLPLTGGPLLVLASTHPGEEELILRQCGRLRRRFLNLQFLIAPRHVERASSIVRMAASLGLCAVRRSEFPRGAGSRLEQTERPDVILLDSMGELRSAMALATLVFVGGSLVDKGGQNPIEAGILGKPMLMGPSVANFEEIVAELVRAGGIVVVRDADELMQQAAELLGDLQRRQELGGRALATARRHRGAADVYARLIGQD
jgi:3-deoxy-D-manno-octulosonic-acid transferase